MRLLKALLVAAPLVVGGGLSMAQDQPAYVPATGDEVVVYTHRFKAENFEEGLELVREGFTAAQAAAGQTRRNYILVDPIDYEVVLISYFAPGSNVDEWHKYMGRLDILEKLEPLRSEPLKLERFTLDAITTAP